MARTPEADTPATPIRRDQVEQRQEDAVAATPPDSGEGAAEASPAADGPPPAQVDGEALIAEMAFPVTGEPDPAADRAHQGGHDAAAKAGDAEQSSPSSGALAPAKPPAAGRGDAANPRVGR